MARVRLLDRNGVAIELDENHPAAFRLTKPEPKRPRRTRAKVKAKADADDDE